MSNDYFSDEGADKIKKRIEDFWIAKGKTVTVHLKRGGYEMQLRKVRTDIRSDMINGFPRK